MIWIFCFVFLDVVRSQCVAGSCNCSWASANSCATNDGSKCNICCCAEFRGVVIAPPPEPSGVVGWQTATTTRYWDCCKVSEGSLLFFIFLFIFMGVIFIHRQKTNSRRALGRMLTLWVHPVALSCVLARKTA